MKQLALVIVVLLYACGTDDGGGEGGAPEAEDVDGEEETATEDGDTVVVTDDDTQTIVAASSALPVEEVIVPFTQWVDPVNGRIWVMIGETSSVVANGGCDDPNYEIPDIWDIQEANVNGIVATLTAEGVTNTYAWTKNLSDGVTESWRNLANPVEWANVTTGAVKWCIEKN